MIYLDNAATSWPKPERIYRVADQVLREESGNPGRSGHSLSMTARRRIEETRFLAARLFNVKKNEHIVFTMNTTDSLNLALRGFLKTGDHVLTSSMEHNSLIRPLEALKKRGIEYTKIPVSPIHGADPDDVKSALRNNTKLIAWNHVSNVSGTINPIKEIGRLCSERGIPLLVDAAQSAGTMQIDVEAMNISLLAFPGHKGLFGPQGTGGLYIREGIKLEPLREGGTGSYSEDSLQPEKLPDRFESGTMNTAGIAALGEGIRFLLDEGLENVVKHEAMLANRLIQGIQDIPGLKLWGPLTNPARKGVVSVSFERMDTAEAALILDNAFGIALRGGLHCAPDAHRTLGTLKTGGTLRISIGYLNTREDIDSCIEALATLA